MNLAARRLNLRIIPRRMDAVGQQNDEHHSLRIDVDRSSGKTRMNDRARRRELSGKRTWTWGIPTQRACAAGWQILALHQQLDSPGFQDPPAPVLPAIQNHLRI